MTQAIITLIKENFLILFEKWEKRPFVILSLVFLGVSIYLGVELRKVTTVKNDLEISSNKRIDSVNSENTILKLQLKDCTKYEDYNVIIDSTLKTMLRNNLLKKNSNE